MSIFAKTFLIIVVSIKFFASDVRGEGTTPIRAPTVKPKQIIPTPQPIETEEADPIFLVRLDLEGFEPVKEITNLPERIFIRRTRMEGEFQFFMTTPKGEIDVGTPMFITVGSVVQGNRLGGKKESYWILDAQGNWNELRPKPGKRYEELVFLAGDAPGERTTALRRPIADIWRPDLEVRRASAGSPTHGAVPSNRKQ